METSVGRNGGRSLGALASGFVAIVLLSLGTDQVLHMLNVYPPWGGRCMALA